MYLWRFLVPLVLEVSLEPLLDKNENPDMVESPEPTDIIDDKSSTEAQDKLESLFLDLKILENLDLIDFFSVIMDPRDVANSAELALSTGSDRVGYFVEPTFLASPLWSAFSARDCKSQLLKLCNRTASLVREALWDIFP